MKMTVEFHVGLFMIAFTKVTVEFSPLHVPPCSGCSLTVGPVVIQVIDARLFAATSPEAKAAGYYGPNWFYELKGPPVPAKIMPQAKDVAVAARLWDVSAALTGVSFDPVAAAA